MNPMCKAASFSASTSKLSWLKRRGLRLAPLLLLTGCTSLDQVAPPVTAAMGNDPHVLEEGRRIYTRECTTCHAAEPIASYSAAQWRTILPDMAERTKLDSARSHAVERYVFAALRVPPAGSR